MSYKNLSIFTLSDALDDISPLTKEEEGKERLAKFFPVEEDFDREWELLEQQAQKELDDFFEKKNKVFQTIKPNTESISKRIDKRFKSDEEKIKKLKTSRNFNLKKIENKLSKGSIDINDYQKEYEEVSDTFQEKIDRIVTERDDYIKDLTEQENSAKIEKRIESFNKTWDQKYKILENRFLVKETNYFIRRQDEDTIRTAVEWFENDFYEVLSHCVSAEMDVKHCYAEVKRRMSIIGRNSDKIDEIIQKIENRDY